MAACKERMIKALKFCQAREMLGHVRYSYFHITVLLDRPTDGSGTWNCQNGSDSRSHSSGMLVDTGRCCFFHRALQEHQSNHEGKILILHTYSFSTVLRSCRFNTASRTRYQLTPANTGFRVLKVNDTPVNIQVLAVTCTKPTSRKLGILHLSLSVTKLMILLPNTQYQSLAVDSMANAIPPVLGSFPSPLRCTAISH